MVANTNPIFPLTPVVSFTGALITTANTAKDGTGTVVLCFTAGANGARIDTVRARAVGSNVATVLRLFVNNGATNGTSTNNSLLTEVTLPATTLSETSQLADVTVQLNIALPATYRIYATIGTTVAAGYLLTGIGGNY